MSKLKNLIVILIIAVITVIILLVYSDEGNRQFKENVGVQAVRYLYQFDNLTQLNANSSKLKNITTDDVYEQLTIDNTDRCLNTYLKFKGVKTGVNIIKATDTYVLYSLDNENISSNRIFMFTYSVNNKGKIEYVREMECIDFITDNY